MVLSYDGKYKSCWTCWKIVEVIQRERPKEKCQEERWKDCREEKCQDNERLLVVSTGSPKAIVTRRTAYFLLPQRRSTTLKL